MLDHAFALAAASGIGNAIGLQGTTKVRKSQWLPATDIIFW
jgi:hypothetical protein